MSDGLGNVSSLGINHLHSKTPQDVGRGGLRVVYYLLENTYKGTSRKGAGLFYVIFTNILIVSSITGKEWYSFFRTVLSKTTSKKFKPQFWKISLNQQ